MKAFILLLCFPCFLLFSTDALAQGKTDIPPKRTNIKKPAPTTKEVKKPYNDSLPWFKHDPMLQLNKSTVRPKQTPKNQKGYTATDDLWQWRKGATNNPSQKTKLGLQPQSQKAGPRPKTAPKKSLNRIPKKNH